MKKIIISLVVLLMLLVGCSSNKGGSSDTNNAAPGSAPNGGYNASYDGGVSYETDHKEGITNGSQQIISENEKLVYTGRLEIQTLQYQETIKLIKDKIKQYQGLIEYESERDNDYYWYNEHSNSATMHMTMTIRIPTKYFDQFINDMEGSGKVISKNTNIENITKQYYDNSAQIKALEIQEERLLKMMEEATTIEEMILVEDRLTDVQIRLNQATSYQATMDNDIEYSTIDMQVDEVVRYTESKTTFLTGLSESFIDGWVNFYYAFRELVFNIVYALPYLIILAIILFILFKKKVLPIKFKSKKKETTTKDTTEDTHG